jgi:hypothetical protein
LDKTGARVMVEAPPDVNADNVRGDIEVNEGI